MADQQQLDHNEGFIATPEDDQDTAAHHDDQEAGRQIAAQMAKLALDSESLELDGEVSVLSDAKSSAGVADGAKDTSDPSRMNKKDIACRYAHAQLLRTYHHQCHPSWCRSSTNIGKPAVRAVM
jgi:hypothetical protein